MESPLDRTCTNEDKKLRRIKIEKMKEEEVKEKLGTEEKFEE